MIQIHKLTITHNKDLRNLASDLTMVIREGEKVAIIGEEGNGKSTLLQTLMGKRPLDFTISGQIHSDFGSYSYIPQSLPADLKTLSLHDYFFSGRDDLDYSLIYRFAEELQFDSDRFTSQQLIGSLSGGEALKVQLIHELSKTFEILFLDEPSNDLDLDTVLWLKKQIQRIKETVIFISHDEDFLSQTANTIVHLRLVKHRKEAETLVEHLDYDRYSQQSRDHFIKQSQQAANEQRVHEKTMEKNRRVKQQVENALRNTKNSTEGRLLAKKMKNILSQEKRFEKSAQSMTQQPLEEDRIQLFFSDVQPLPASKVLLHFEQQTLFVEDRQLADKLKLTVRGQDKIGIIGPNGIGKSTLLAKIYHLLQDKGYPRLSFLSHNRLNKQKNRIRQS